jgi:hypothetical protein
MVAGDRSKVERREVILEEGAFHVSDDPEGVLSTVLAVSTNNVNRSRIAEALAPDGSGFHIDAVGSVGRVTSREDHPGGPELQVVRVREVDLGQADPFIGMAGAEHPQPQPAEGR